MSVLVRATARRVSAMPTTGVPGGHDDLSAFQAFLDASLRELIGESGSAFAAPVEIKPSGIDEGGLGVYATRDISTGERVCYYAGEYVPATDLKSDQEKTHALHVSIVPLTQSTSSMAIDGRIFRKLVADEENPGPAQTYAWAAGCMINAAIKSNVRHHSEPDEDDAQANRIFIFDGVQYGYALTEVTAICDIRKGDELLCNYAPKMVAPDGHIYGARAKYDAFKATQAQSVRATKRRIVPTAVSATSQEPPPKEPRVGGENSAA